MKTNALPAIILEQHTVHDVSLLFLHNCALWGILLGQSSLPDCGVTCISFLFTGNRVVKMSQFNSYSISQ